jgi:hypothetical protein
MNLFSLGSSTSSIKMEDPDPYFEKKKQDLEILENQLKGLFKAIEGVLKQRKGMILLQLTHRLDLGEACFDFGNQLLNLSSLEVQKSVSQNLVKIGNIIKQLKVLHEQQAKHDFTYFMHTLDEYLRIVTSAKVIFASGLIERMPFLLETSITRTGSTLKSIIKRNKTPWQSCKQPLGSDPIKLHKQRLTLIR